MPLIMFSPSSVKRYSPVTMQEIQSNTAFLNKIEPWGYSILHTIFEFTHRPTDFSGDF